MLSKDCELTGFTFHCGVPHMRGIDRNDQIYSIIFLEDCKFARVFRIWSWKTSTPPRHFWLKRRIEQILKSWSRKKFGKALQVGKGNRWLNFPQGHKTLNI